MEHRGVVVVGGGAAGFFAAITCAEASPESRPLVLERGPAFLEKVRISGGGRCNVTHACFDPRELSTRYPRGGRALIGAFHRFQPRDTVGWFEARGVRLKTEEDGRMFPITDASQTIVDCLVQAARAAGVTCIPGCGVDRVVRRPEGGFRLGLSNGRELTCDRLLLAMGGCRGAAAGQLAVGLGHTLEPPVPSLFTFQVEVSWVRELAGIAVDPVVATVPSFGLRERGPVLLTHGGLSGPLILKLSAWGARVMHEADYRFALHLDWLPGMGEAELMREFDARRGEHGARQLRGTPVAPIPGRLWERLVSAAGVPAGRTWAGLTRVERQQLARQLRATELPVSGKSLNREEFVTCGGVRLAEVDFKTMESRRCPGLHFAGELLDIDGLTGGFNFQAAWTTGWLAGRAMAETFDTL